MDNLRLFLAIAAVVLSTWALYRPAPAVQLKQSLEDGQLKITREGANSSDVNPESIIAPALKHSDIMRLCAEGFDKVIDETPSVALLKGLTPPAEWPAAIRRLRASVLQQMKEQHTIPKRCEGMETWEPAP